MLRIVRIRQDEQLRHKGQHLVYQIIRRKLFCILLLISLDAYYGSIIILLANNIFSMMSSSQCSGQSNNSCGGHSNGYAAWPSVPGHNQFTENFYNNPIQYPTNCSILPHRYATNGQQTHYTQQQPNLRNGHPHCPPNHAHSSDYQLFNPNSRKCNNTR